MPFVREECYNKIVWCGKGRKPSGVKNNNIYTVTGTRYECLKQGIGAGKYSEKKKNIPSNSIRNIKYVGEEYEKRFKSRGIKTLTQLVKIFRGLNADEKRRLLQSFLKKGNGYDGRAYNNILLYLDSKNIKKLPACFKK